MIERGLTARLRRAAEQFTAVTLTGSQNLALLESVSQSLAGRTAVLHLLPLARSEVVRFTDPPQTLDETAVTGGYPRIFDRQLDPSDWLSAYAATYLKRDLRTISNVGDLNAFQRFVELCAGRPSQLLNYSAAPPTAASQDPTPLTVRPHRPRRAVPPRAAENPSEMGRVEQSPAPDWHPDSVGRGNDDYFFLKLRAAFPGIPR